MNQVVVHFDEVNLFQQNPQSYPCLTIRIYERCIRSTEIKPNILNQTSSQVVHFMI